jgi:hypothetical protein
MCEIDNIYNMKNISGVEHVESKRLARESSAVAVVINTTVIGTMNEIMFIDYL